MSVAYEELKKDALERAKELDKNDTLNGILYASLPNSEDRTDYPKWEENSKKIAKKHRKKLEKWI